MEARNRFNSIVKTKRDFKPSCSRDFTRTVAPWNIWFIEQKKYVMFHYLYKSTVLDIDSAV